MYLYLFNLKDNVLHTTPCKFNVTCIWRPPNLNSELNPVIFDMELTHLSSEASIHGIVIEI